MSVKREIFKTSGVELRWFFFINRLFMDELMGPWRGIYAGGIEVLSWMRHF